jgi:phosphomannomutase
MRTNHFNPDQELIHDLKNFLIKSRHNTKTGNHIEHRTGMINFSVVGRNASDSERRLYNLWDKKYEERQKIADFLRNKYPELNVSIGGSISIDISPMGFDKSQVIEYLVSNKDVEEIVFFGDKTDPGGNDYGLITSLDRYNIESFRWHKVNGPKHLSELLNL